MRERRSRFRGNGFEFSDGLRIGRSMQFPGHPARLTPAPHSHARRRDANLATILDVHCHVLPGLDDGPATMAEAIETLREAERQGVGGMIVTPHQHPGRYFTHSDEVLEALEKLRQAARSAGVSVRLYPGHECLYDRGLLRRLTSKDALTLADSDCVLVEFAPDAPFQALVRAALELGEAGYVPVIAHFERYRCLHGRPERLARLRQLGALLQMNFDALLPRGLLIPGNPWRRLMKAGAVDLVGSDTHGMVFRPLHAAQAVKWIRAAVPGEIADRVLARNARRLIAGRRGE